MSDLIFRENVLKNFENMCEDCFSYTREEKEEVICRRCFIQTVKDIIKESPSVESERKKGEWIFHIDDLFPEESTQECSVCHEEESIRIYNDNFCPNCGADMRSE